MSGVFWELLQQRRLAQTGIDANRAQRAAFDARREVSALEDQVERLSLGFRALWELCCEHTGLTEDDFLARVRDIDLRDGKLDGRIDQGTVECPSCSRVNAYKRVQCLYCAQPLPARAL